MRVFGLSKSSFKLQRILILSKLGRSITIMTHFGEIRRQSVTLVNGLRFNNDALQYNPSSSIVQ